MYSTLKIEKEGTSTTESKGKGIPTHYLKAKISLDDFRNMLLNPLTESQGASKRFQSFGHLIHTMEVSKKMLTAVQDKTYQIDAFTSQIGRAHV